MHCRIPPDSKSRVSHIHLVYSLPTTPSQVRILTSLCKSTSSGLKWRVLPKQQATTVLKQKNTEEEKEEDSTAEEQLLLKSSAREAVHAATYHK